MYMVICSSKEGDNQEMLPVINHYHKRAVDYYRSVHPYQSISNSAESMMRADQSHRVQISSSASILISS